MMKPKLKTKLATKMRVPQSPAFDGMTTATAVMMMQIFMNTAVIHPLIYLALIYSRLPTSVLT
jgi:hypothetical protein